MLRALLLTADPAEVRVANLIAFAPASSLASSECGKSTCASWLIAECRAGLLQTSHCKCALSAPLAPAGGLCARPAVARHEAPAAPAGPGEAAAPAVPHLCS